MNTLEKQMVKTLADLRTFHHVLGVKAEFEAEGTRLEEAMRLKEVVTKAGLDLTIKIGGCEAVKDMYDAKVIGVNTIVAPMIESPYAMKKYVQCTKMVFHDYQDIKFLFNLETETGYKNLDTMLASKEMKDIDGIVLGRVDMTGSLGMSREDINNEEIFKICRDVAQKTLAHKKELVIGGGVSAQSLPFFAKLPEGALNRFETRKIIFDAQAMLKDKNAEKGILKAVGFELMWLKNKRDFYGTIHLEDAKRIDMLEARYKKLIEEAGGHIQ